MNKISIIILSSILIFFIVALSCGLYFTNATPDMEKITDKYVNAGYAVSQVKLGEHMARTFTKDGETVMTFWYKDKDFAQKSFDAINKLKGKKFIIRRGNAIAIGYEKDIKIFQFG